MRNTAIKLSLSAMATQFEMTLYGDDPVHVRASGEEAFREIERLDQRLSYYNPQSEIRQINSRAAVVEVKVEPRLFSLLKLCREVWEKTDGAFDITVAPLMKAWGFVGGSGRMRDSEDVEVSRNMSGMRHVKLDEKDSTVRFDCEGTEIDLGAVGKGYAIEQAVAILRENGISRALIHGGTSTIYGLGTQPDGSPWKIGIGVSGRSNQSAVISDQSPGNQQPTSHVQRLEDCALSVSAVHGKSFIHEGKELGHVIDPRTGLPVEGPLTAVMRGPSPTLCDMLSTALLVLGGPGLRILGERFSDYEALLEGGNFAH